MFPVAVYQIQNGTIYYDWSNLHVQIIQDHSHHLRLSQTQRPTSYVGRVLHPPLKEITVTRNLIQGSGRGFSISIVKNILQNKKNIVVCCKKNKENQVHSVDKEIQYTRHLQIWGQPEINYWKTRNSGKMSLPVSPQLIIQ